jgi:hypothetical protein
LSLVSELMNHLPFLFSPKALTNNVPIILSQQHSHSSPNTPTPHLPITPIPQIKFLQHLTF